MKYSQRQEEEAETKASFPIKIKTKMPESSKGVQIALVRQNQTMRYYRVGRWDKREHQAFLKGLKLYGRSWKRISEYVATRSSVQARTHAQKYFLSSPFTKKENLVSPTKKEVPSKKKTSIDSLTNGLLCDADFGCLCDSDMSLTRDVIVPLAILPQFSEATRQGKTECAESVDSDFDYLLAETCFSRCETSPLEENIEEVDNEDQHTGIYHDYDFCYEDLLDTADESPEANSVGKIGSRLYCTQTAMPLVLRVCSTSVSKGGISR
mmetsp:Transcript_35263/g.43532  ORF Transcript_35263/g.43532 Transcript_35263/m.43532 type:complete len:266 (+) Transcript_35263:97-894(+)